MSKLHFRLDLGSSEVDALDLPVEVRKPNYVLAARTTVSQPIDLNPGIYFCLATLPAGQELFDRVEVEQGQETFAVLTAASEDRSPHESQAAPHFLKGLSSAVPSSRGLESLGTEGTKAIRLRAFQGNLLQGAAVASDPWHWPPSYRGDFLTLDVAPAAAVQWAQLLQPNRPAVNIALPVSEQRGCRLIITLSGDGYAANVQLENLTTETLLQYLAKGRLKAASTITEKTSDAYIAENLLQTKLGDPIAAAVGAYALLRLDEVALLHNWTENLRNWFTWLPDGVAIRAEHLARLGQHSEALAVLLELDRRGLPVFCDGFSYAIDRLRFYTSLSKSNLPLEKLQLARALLEKLQRFAKYADFRRSILTFTGLDPAHPDDEPLSEDLTAHGGRDLSVYL